jgi:anaerobic selenocysteine-containing dehydrogenase
VRLPTQPGLDTMGCLEAAAAGRLKTGFCLGGNLYGANPDASFAAAALGKLDQVVYLSTSLNTGHTHGLAGETIILPVLARDEEPQSTTQESMFSYVRLSDGGPRRHEGPRSEVAIISGLAADVLGAAGPVDWRAMSDTRRIRETIGRIVPGLEQIDQLDQTGKEFHIPGRAFHEPRFATANGRAQLHVNPLPELNGDGAGTVNGSLRLMTVRSEGQFNTVVYEEEDIYRDQDRRDVILVHPDDIARLGLKAEQWVMVRSEAGALAGILVRPFDRIKPGNALMYYPEANVLVPRTIDPQSKTPAFKNVVVRIEAGGPGLLLDDSAPVTANGPSSRDTMRAC